jgi:hypothetical protein
MSAPIVEKPGQAHARNQDQGGAGGTASSSSDRQATPIAATGPGRREEPSPHFESVALAPDVKVRSRRTLRCADQSTGTALRKDLCKPNATNASGTRSITAAMLPGAWPVGMLTRQGLMSPQSSSLNVVAAEETTLQTTVAAVSEKRRRQLLQIERYGNAVEGMVFPRACLRLSMLRLSQILNRRHLERAGTTLSKRAAY